MTEQEERLARAWLSLVGWRVGMVTRNGSVMDQRRIDAMADGTRVTLSLPALDSPANWGHWLAWTDEACDGVSLLRDGTRWVAELASGKVFSDSHSNPAAALLELAIRDGRAGTEAPAVLEWRKHEQEAERC